jgi:hypothetical protein
MAFQQFDHVPSMAPVSAPARATTAPARTAAPAARASNGYASLLTSIAIGALALFMIGYEVTEAMESLAIGLIAADLVFLAVAAGWAVVSDGRH